jgi:hypothetical protein
MSDRTANLVQIIQIAAGLLQPKIPFADALSLLGALAEVESSFGEFAVPKYEKAYDWGGPYFSVEQRERWKRWGAWAACSYSSFQIMYPTACELGFTGTPIELCKDNVAIDWVMKLIERRIIDRGATTIMQVADAYNSGSFRDAMYPNEYIKKFSDAYATVVSRRGLRTVIQA